MSFCRLAKALAALDRPAVLVKTPRGVDLIVDGRPLFGIADAEALAVAERAVKEGGRASAGGVEAEVVQPKPLIVVVGFGEVAKALVKLAKAMGYLVAAAGVGGADIELEPGEIDEELLSKAPVVIATEGGSPHDLPLFVKALRAGSPYVALMASRQRAAYFIAQALKAGVPLDDIRARASTPAGIDIGAKTPGEVALSILAEAVARLRGGTLKLMREVKDPYPLLREPPPNEPSCSWAP
ncbi:MAG: XdhC family protein [Thermoproteus sp. AZ2]|jgi:xanthine dehydrogenase accessory factor|uniref:XdhC family protein n=1 Tax=Thermoproteus sp. AZ2 TaxID=1609232 RepID=A0ACC6V1G8_9CREN|nr:MAG: hypothetical protein TU35_04115 [Thermoproteus sp. AZ2]